jgi:lipid-binding SYLF domain-containing protein
MKSVIRNWIFLPSTAVMAFLIAVVSTPAASAPRQDARLLNATEVLKELQSSPDQNVPHWLLERAYAVAIVPDVIKVGLGIGARRGNGVLVVRNSNGHWTNPVFINLTGGSFGFQMGVQSTDVLLVFTSRTGIEGIVGGKVTLGADASVAAGPVGRQTAAATDIGFNAQVYSYSRAKGLFAGVALDGSALTIDHKSNAAYYGRPGVLASEIIAGSAPPPPETGRDFIATLNQMLGIAKPADAVAAGSTSATAPASTSVTTPTTLPANPGSLTTHPMEDQHPGAEPPQ